MSSQPHVLDSPSAGNGVVAFAVLLHGAAMNVTYDGKEVCAPVSGALAEAAIDAVRAYIVQRSAEVASLLRRAKEAPAAEPDHSRRTCEDAD